MRSQSKPNSIANFWQLNVQTVSCGAPPFKSTVLASENDDKFGIDRGMMGGVYDGGSIDPRREVIADTAGVTGCESDESLLSPGGSPGVLDGVGGAGVPDEQDVVVEVAAAVVEDS